MESRLNGMVGSRPLQKRRKTSFQPLRLAKTPANRRPLLQSQKLKSHLPLLNSQRRKPFQSSLRSPLPLNERDSFRVVRSVFILFFLQRSYPSRLATQAVDTYDHSLVCKQDRLTHILSLPLSQSQFVMKQRWSISVAPLVQLAISLSVLASSCPMATAFGNSDSRA